MSTTASPLFYIQALSYQAFVSTEFREIGGLFKEGNELDRDSE